MATNFPNELDNFVNPNPNDPLSRPSHAEQHQNANDAIEALQTKVGIDGSQDQNSLDYRISQLESESGQDIVEKLGLEGNNTTEITGIENPTVIDSFDSNIWSSATYRVQIRKSPHAYVSTIAVSDVDNVLSVSEYDIISDEEVTLANLDFTRNGSIINLLVTPVLWPIEVRFYRTALKK